MGPPRGTDRPYAGNCTDRKTTINCPSRRPTSSIPALSYRRRVPALNCFSDANVQGERTTLHVAGSHNNNTFRDESEPNAPASRHRLALVKRRRSSVLHRGKPVDRRRTPSTASPLRQPPCFSNALEVLPCRSQSTPYTLWEVAYETSH